MTPGSSSGASHRTDIPDIKSEQGCDFDLTGFPESSGVGAIHSDFEGRMVFRIGFCGKKGRMSKERKRIK